MTKLYMPRPDSPICQECGFRTEDVRKRNLVFGVTLCDSCFNTVRSKIIEDRQRIQATTQATTGDPNAKK